jgi:hypothetical protein
MGLKSFQAPPFVVWRVFDIPSAKDDCYPLYEADPSSRGFADHPAELSHYRLVPHAVFREISRHCYAQALAIVFIALSFLGNNPETSEVFDAFVYRNISSKIAIQESLIHECSLVLATIVGGLLLAVGSLAILLTLGAIANALVMRLLNARSMQTIEALLHHCPAASRAEFDQSFPAIFERHNERHRDREIVRWKPAFRITGQTFLFFFVSSPLSRRLPSGSLVERIWLACLASRRFFQKSRFAVARMITASTSRHRRRVSPSNPPKGASSGAVLYTRRQLDRRLRRLNRAKLGSLSLRREDSPLQAFSSFAAITTFVPHQRRIIRIPRKHIEFLIGYFSPIGFGFLLCLLIFGTYPLLAIVGNTISSGPAPVPAPSKFTMMIPILIWFVLGLVYLRYTIDQDFSALFKNYFKARRFPATMTRFALDQIERAPDLVEVIQSNALSFFIAVLLFGLAALYAGFLQSL